MVSQAPQHSRLTRPISTVEERLAGCSDLPTWTVDDLLPEAINMEEEQQEEEVTAQLGGWAGSEQGSCAVWIAILGGWKS